MSDECPKLCWLNGKPKGEHYPGCPESLHGRMASMLRRLEWAGSDCSPYGDGCDEACPVCGAVKSAFMGDPRPGFGQHEPTCDLAALLKDLP